MKKNIQTKDFSLLQYFSLKRSSSLKGWSCVIPKEVHSRFAYLCRGKKNCYGKKISDLVEMIALNILTEGDIEALYEVYYLLINIY